MEGLAKRLFETKDLIFDLRSTKDPPTRESRVIDVALAPSSRISCLYPEKISFSMRIVFLIASKAHVDGSVSFRCRFVIRFVQNYKRSKKEKGGEEESSSITRCIRLCFFALPISIQKKKGGRTKECAIVLSQRSIITAIYLHQLYKRK